MTKSFPNKFNTNCHSWIKFMCLISVRNRYKFGINTSNKLKRQNNSTLTLQIIKHFQYKLRRRILPIFSKKVSFKGTLLSINSYWLPFCKLTRTHAVLGRALRTPNPADATAAKLWMGLSTARFRSPCDDSPLGDPRGTSTATAIHAHPDWSGRLNQRLNPRQ